MGIEEIDFGTIGKDEVATRMLVLYNNSGSKNLHFSFEQNDITCDDALKITPSCGDLEAGEFVEIKFRLTSKYIPSIYEGELTCSVYWLGSDSDNMHQIKPQKSGINLPCKPTRA